MEEGKNSTTSNRLSLIDQDDVNVYNTEIYIIVNINWYSIQLNQLIFCAAKTALSFSQQTNFANFNIFITFSPA